VDDKIIKDPKTLATAIKIGNPASWQQAKQARDESGGVIEKVTDDEIIEAYNLLASELGVFVEPASASSVAGILKKAKQGYFSSDKKEEKKKNIVCVLTGHGLKDPDRAIKCVNYPVVVDPNISEVIKQIGKF